MSKEKETKPIKKRSSGAGRKPKPVLSDKAIATAKRIIAIIAPHIPVASLDPVVLAETVINYGLEQAEILDNNVQLQKLVEANETRAVIAKLEESVRKLESGEIE